MGSDNKPKGNDIVSGASDKVNYVFLVIASTVGIAIGSGFALGIIQLILDEKSKIKVSDKIATLASDDLHWVYLSIVLLGRMIAYINFFPAGFKSHLKGNVRSNPFFYETVGDDVTTTTVALKETGALGMYNRSNRSIHHMVENFGAFLVSIVPVGYVYPKPVFVLVSLFCMGRIMHQAGYSRGYGKHAIGFLLSNVIATTTMEGLALLVFLKANGIL